MSFGIGSICRSHMVLLWLWGRTQLQFDSTPSLGISICCQCGHKKEMEKKKQPNQWICRHLQPASFAQPVNPHLIICWPLIKENPEIPRLPSCFSEVSGPESPAAVQYALDMRAPFGPPLTPRRPLAFLSSEWQSPKGFLLSYVPVQVSPNRPCWVTTSHGPAFFLEQLQIL